MFRVRVGVPYVSEEVIFGCKVNRREVRVLGGGTESFSNAVVKRVLVGNVDRTITFKVSQMSQGRTIHDLSVGLGQIRALNAVVLSGNIIHWDARVKWSIGRGLARS